jgi:adenylylsulfate kinase-like enzyme
MATEDIDNAVRDETGCPTFIYINGYAGVGKLTIATCLLPLLPQPAKLLDNHLLIDPVAALLDRTSAEYQPLRKSVRQLMLSAICNSTELKQTTLVFTDQQSSSPLGSSVAREYEAAASNRNARFLSIRLQCNEEEHLRRALSGDRVKGLWTKLTNEKFIRLMREKEDVFMFGGEDELTIDVTDLSPHQAAQSIAEFVRRRALDSAKIGM